MMAGGPSRLAFRLLLRAYPRAFRARFGDEMAAAFEDERRRALADGGFALLRLWLRSARELLACGLIERLVPTAPRRRSHANRSEESPMPTALTLLHDALRGALRAPRFTAVAAGTLALGIAVVATVLSLVDAVLLRPLPFEDPERLVRVWSAHQDSGRRFLELAGWDVLAIERSSTAFSALAAFSIVDRDLEDHAAGGERLSVARVSGDFFAVLGVQAALGHTFQADDAGGEAPAVVLSHGLWQRRYGGDPAIVGRTVRLRRQPYLVSGVMPPGFGYPASAQLWRPLAREALADDDPELHVIARLAPGVDAARVDAELAQIGAGLRRAMPESHAGLALWAQPLGAMVARQVRGPLLLLLGAAGLVLLVTCVNVAGLVLTRVTARRREMAIRGALGADRGRLIGQLLAEGLVLAALGGALGLVLARWLLSLLLAISPYRLPLTIPVALDLRVALAMLAVTALVGLGSGALPALRLTARGGLHTGDAGGDRGGRRWRDGLVVVEVALASVLVLAAGFLGSSLQRLVDLDRGFDAGDLVAIELGLDHHTELAPSAARYRRLETAIEALPAVRAAAVAQRGPLDTVGLRLPFQLQGVLERPPDKRPKAVMRPVSAGYFATLGIRVLAGRDFTASDHAAAPGAVIVNQAFVRAHLAAAGVEPLGLRLDRPAWWGERPPFADTVVGVVADLEPEIGLGAVPMLYFPFDQTPFHDATLLVRTTRDAEAMTAIVRDAVWAAEPSFAIGTVTTVARQIAESAAAPRFQALLVGTFGGLALTLAAVGLYGVIAFTVVQRRREIGIRRALGATGDRIVGMVVAHGLLLAAGGIAAGTLAAWWLARTLEGQLFGVRASDLGPYAGGLLVLLAITALACFLPARRATQIDPVRTLRHDR